MTHVRKLNPRAAFRLRETERVKNSATLAEKFPTLKSMKVVLNYYDRERLQMTGEVKYVVNVLHAKSVFSFVCTNPECVEGDFDLSHVVAEAVSQRRTTAEGEIRCMGERYRPKAERVPCGNLLRYKLTLGYQRRPVT